MLDDMLGRANSVCLPALSRADRRVLDLMLVMRVDCAVLHCCAVITVFLLYDGGSRCLMLGDNVLVYTRTSYAYVRKRVPQKANNGRGPLLF